MNSKKAITLLVLTTLLMTLVPILPVHAIVLTDLGNPSVQKGDELTILGTGVTAGATVNVYWDDALKETFTEGSGKLGSGKAKANGSFDIDVDVPEAVAGPHYIWVKDTFTGNTAGGEGPGEVTVVPKFTVSSSSGLKGDKITIKGYGYGYDEDEEEGLDVTVTFGNSIITGDPLAAAPSTDPVTNVLGTWTYVFTITAEDYATDYPIDAEDTDFNADATYYFTVGASITLNIEEGPVGSVVTISGRGFEALDPTVSVDIDGLPCYIISGDTVRSDGRITTRVVIPSIAEGEYTITVEDDPLVGVMPLNVAEADFEVNGVAKVKATPSYGPQGGQIVVEGWNFTKLSNTEVDVTIGGLQAKTFKTDATGYFKGTYTIPAVASGDPELKAEQEDHDIVATSTVRVGVMLVILTPTSGPSGTSISMSGVGFTGGEIFTAYVGEDEWATGTVQGDGTIFVVEQMPTLDPGLYTVKVVDEDTEIEVLGSFTVTERTKIELDPTKAPRSTDSAFEVTVEGWYFAEDPDIDTLEFLLYNATQEWLLAVEYNGATVVLEADDDWDPGYFEGTFEVPNEDEIDLGMYTLNVTDGEGMYAQILFEIVSKTVEIDPRKATFRIGETVAFNVESSFAQPDSYIKIMDPSGAQYWATDDFVAANWITVGTLKVYPIYQQTAGGNPMVLLEDAPLGTYSWTWYADDGDVIDSGTFTVAASTEDVLGQQIEDLNSAVTDLQQDVTTVSSEVAAARTQITNAINAANAATEAANAATQAVNSVAQTANAASTAAQQAAQAANEAKNAANGLTTLVYGAIGASLVAALAAIVSLMQISRRIAG